MSRLSDANMSSRSSSLEYISCRLATISSTCVKFRCTNETWVKVSYMPDRTTLVGIMRHTRLIWSNVFTIFCGSRHILSTLAISSLMVCTLFLVLKSFLSPSRVASSWSLTPLFSLESMEAFSFSSFFLNTAIFRRSSGDWRYSPTAWAALADVGTDMVYCCEGPTRINREQRVRMIRSCGKRKIFPIWEYGLESGWTFKIVN